MKLYYFHDGQAERGPYQLHELPKDQLSRATPVWHEGLAEWTTLENIPELAALLPAPPPFHASPDDPKRKKTKKHLLTALLIFLGLVLAGLVGWLVHSNRNQAAAIESLQKENTAAQFELAKQQAEQQVQLEAQKQKETTTQQQSDSINLRDRAYRNNWKTYINVSSNEYKSKKLGGIKGLAVTVTNGTGSLLDEVVATVIYVKKNGDTWKTIEVPLTNVPAKGSKTVAVPDVERAKSVQVEIKSIVSKQLHFYYAEGYSSSNPDDPYFSK